MSKMEGESRRGAASELREGGKPFALGGRRGARDNYGGNVRGQTGGEKLIAEGREIVAGHVDDEGGILAGERAPIYFLAAVRILRLMAGDDDDARGRAAIGE